MPFVEPFRVACFIEQYNYLFNGKFHKSKVESDKIISSIISDPLQGDRFPGFGQNIHIRKIRLGLKEYRISKRDGLRVIWLLSEEKQWVLLVAIYYKCEYKHERTIQAMIRKNLNAINAHIDKEFLQCSTHDP